MARFGGDEFVVLQERINSLDDASTLANRIVDMISRPFENGNERFEIGASIGVAFAPADGSEADDLLRRADEAMYACKSVGGSGYRFHRSQ